MKEGMLWLDDDKKRPLAEKGQGQPWLGRAADYYRRKYGRAPDTCQVNPKMMQNGQAEPVSAVGTVTVSTSRMVLMHHFWLGVEDESGQA